MKLTPPPFLIALLLAPLTTAYAADAFLVKDGQPRAEIIIAEKPARMAMFAAKELQTYLQKISGAKLDIVTRPSRTRPRVYVGRSGFTEALKLSTAGLENGAFRQASGEGWLALLGPDEDYVPIEPWGRYRSQQETRRVNAEWDKITGDTFWNHCDQLYIRYHKDLDVWDYDDAGTLNAVYAFLRSLGVRWFAPGELGEIVPQQATIALPDINRIVGPDFALRRLSYFTDHLGLGEVGLWNLRLGLNFGPKLIGVTQPAHGIKFVLWRDEMKRAHPEMYLLHDGKRDTTHHGTGAPCLSSPVLFQEQLRYARAMFDNFRQPMISIDMVDGYGGLRCEDAECRRQFTPERGASGSLSDYVWGYLNRVALELHRSHPDRLVSGLAYSAYQLPPEKIATLNPNLAIVECRSRSRFYDEETRRYHHALRESWLKKLPSGKYFTWDYYLDGRPNEAGRPVFFPRLIARDLRELKGISLGDTIEVYLHQPGTEANFGYDALAIEHLNLYVTSRLWWDCEQDLDALLNDYYAKYYGPAAAPMKAFIEFAETNWMHMSQDPVSIRRAFALLQAAQAAVDAPSVHGRRIQKIADYMKPLRALQQQLGRKHDSDLSYRVLETWQAGGRPMKGKPLDGQLSLEFWPKVRIAPLVNLLPGGRPNASSQFQILREGDLLYFGIRCNEPDMRGLNITSTTSDDPKLLAGDYVSLLIETPARSYYEIAINPAGAVLEIDRGEGGSLKWSSSAQVAVHRDEGFWSLEMRLPIAGEGARMLDPLTGIDGARPKDLFPWYFNVCRQRVRGKEVERTAYSPTGTNDFHFPAKFAKLWGN